MALRKPDGAAPAAPAAPAAQAAFPAAGQAPQFEAMDDDADVAVAERPEAADTSTTQVDSSEMKTAIAVAQASAVATVSPNVGSQFLAQIEEMRGAMDFSYGNFSIFKGNQGDISGGDPSVSLGRWVKVVMIAWDEHWQSNPGSDVDEAKDTVAFSRDGVKIDNIIGEQYREHTTKTLDEYVEWLKVNTQFTEADKSRYIDLCVIPQEVENPGAVALIGEPLQITLNPSSLSSFKAYQETLKAKARAVERKVPGMSLPDDPFTFYLSVQAAEKGGKKWTKLQVTPSLPPQFRR